MGANTVAKPDLIAWFTCGNSAIIDGLDPGPDSPCRMERRTSEIAQIEVIGKSGAAQKALARKQGWKFKHGVPYCPSC